MLLTAERAGAEAAPLCYQGLPGSPSDNIFAIALKCFVVNLSYVAPYSTSQLSSPPYSGFGFWATGGGTIEQTVSPPPVAITTNYYAFQQNAYGIWSDGDGSGITLTSATIETKGSGASGAGSIGAFVSGGGQASLDNSSIITWSQDSHALAVTGSGSQVSLTGSNSFVTNGNGAIGLAVSQGGTLTATDATTVTTSGGVSPATGLGAYGVNADGSGSTITLASATVTTNGAGATGLLASDVNNSGAAGSIVVTGALTVTTYNPAAAAIGLQGDGASIVATGGGTIVSAGDAIAFLGGTNQTATFDNFTKIANTTGDLIFADASAATVNFNNVTANAGTNNLLNATGGSVVTLNAAASTLNGAIQTAGASASTVNLSNGSSWTGAIATDSTSTSTVNLTTGSSATVSLANGSSWTGAMTTDSTSTSTLNMSDRSTWTMTGSSTVSMLTVSNSYVVFSPPASGAGGGFKTLTLGNYVGAGGFVTMNATLGGSGSPSDQIVINGGKATGSTMLTVRNVGGLGGQTTGAGIPVIVAVNGGTIAQNAFALANTPVVGGYVYTLEQSGQDLYLVSALTTTPAQQATSITNVTKAQQNALTTSRVLGSILVGATEQVNCSNCSSGARPHESDARGHGDGRLLLRPVQRPGGHRHQRADVRRLAGLRSGQSRIQPSVL